MSRRNLRELSQATGLRDFRESENRSRNSAIRYTLRPTSDFLKELEKLDKSIKDLVAKKLERIKENPLLSKPLKHEPNCYSERIVNYRIVFEVKGSEVILYQQLCCCAIDQ
ncbi:hypothetical protein COS70_03035 [Candidatus Micrarchaeota archaeon CG06_land_8_20_14_3_00_50_6]|nr:MAG: hypothetical protein COS70_03035 [Candidatus Micrarchaeota archaeon CG06_land_8_20_14_3_00_50_6]